MTLTHALITFYMHYAKLYLYHYKGGEFRECEQVWDKFPLKTNLGQNTEVTMTIVHSGNSSCRKSRDALRALSMISKSQWTLDFGIVVKSSRLRDQCRVRFLRGGR